MISHQPDDYSCPFCRFLSGRYTDRNGAEDIVHKDDMTTAFISPRWWPKNQGHVLVIPNAHHENLYEVPAEAGHAVHDAVQRIAIAIRETYDCDGTSVRQHNEPSGNQDVWHYHVHVYPRYEGDQLYKTSALPGFVTPEQRRPYAERLRRHLA